MPTPSVRRCLLALLGAVLTSFLVAPVASAEAAPLGKRALTTGARGDDVRQLQRLLTRAGFASKADGVFGRGTFRSVRRLERELGLRVDGVMTGKDVRRVRVALSPAAGTGGFGMTEEEQQQKSRAASEQQVAGSKATLTEDGLAIAPADAPAAVKKVIAAGNEIATKPYRYGGGHGKWEDSGYDCSGSVSFALHGGGLLERSMPSGGFTSWGESGAGEWITIYANSGHMYMTVAGLRFDTSGRSKSGSRWQKDPRPSSGYSVRHPEGL